MNRSSTKSGLGGQYWGWGNFGAARSHNYLPFMSDNPTDRLSVQILADPSFCGLLEVLLGRLSKLVPVIGRLETSMSGYAIH